MANLVIKVSSNESKQNLRDAMSFGSKADAASFLQRLAKAIGPNAQVEVAIQNDNGTPATGTITIDNTKIAANDTLTLADTTFTAVASGATGHQFNIGADATATAVNLAAAINTNASVDFGGKLSATSNGANVVLTVSENTYLGNVISVTKTEAVSGALTLPGTRLGSGQSDSGTSVSFKNW